MSGRSDDSGLPPGLTVADLGPRFGAWLFDAGAVLVTGGALLLLAQAAGLSAVSDEWIRQTHADGLTTPSVPMLTVNMPALAILLVIWVVASVAAFAWYWAKRRGTPVQRAMSLQVGDAGTGNTLPLSRALARSLLLWGVPVLLVAAAVWLMFSATTQVAPRFDWRNYSETHGQVELAEDAAWGWYWSQCAGPLTLAALWLGAILLITLAANRHRGLHDLAAGSLVVGVDSAVIDPYRRGFEAMYLAPAGTPWMPPQQAWSPIPPASSPWPPSPSPAPWTPNPWSPPPSPAPWTPTGQPSAWPPAQAQAPSWPGQPVPWTAQPQHWPGQPMYYPPSVRTGPGYPMPASWDPAGQADRGPSYQPPDAAVSAISSVCGSLPPERLFTIPQATHLAGTHSVETPTEVLGFGDESVALWIDDGKTGQLSTVRIADLLIVEDRQILLYGKLRLVAAQNHVSVRYNTASRDRLETGLDFLRRRMAQTAFPTESTFVWTDPRGAGGRPDLLPHKWAVVLEKPSVRADFTEPVRVAVGAVTATRERDEPASGVAILSPRELVIATDPAKYLESGPRYGVDIIAIPRDRLLGLRWTGHFLAIRAGGKGAGQETSVSLALDPSLAQAMRQAFGTQVEWS